MACSKKGPEKDVLNGLPSSKVPDELATGSWFSGTLSAISYWDRDGHQLGHDHEAGREFQFRNTNGKGTVHFWQYLGMRNYSGCITEIYTRKEGTVAFNGDKFTFYAAKGSFRTVKEKCSTGNGATTRNAGADDLQPTTYRWEIRMIEGKPYLYTFSEDDVNHETALFIYENAE
jgi:hypothetical protein